MLELFSSGLLSLWLERAEASQVEVPLNLPAIEQAPLFLMDNHPDPTGARSLKEYLGELNALGFDSEGQGIWLQSDYQVLSAHQGMTPLPAASITKVATSLVALKQWGANHQFETLIGTTGIIQDGVLQGDLIIQGGSDPLFVWEQAIALGNVLNQFGIRKVTGNLVISGTFAMNFEADPQLAGQFLKQALDARNWPAEAIYYYSKMPPGTTRPLVEIGGIVQVSPEPVPMQRLLLRHNSFALVQLLKQMNIYSNNAMADMFAQGLGGGPVVAKRAARAAGVPESEIQLINGSGLGQENRISPRAATALFQALQRELKRWKSTSGTAYTIGDLFPVAGLDQGTIIDRNIPSDSVVKTGTLSDVSALAGILPTRDRGLVWFAILNRGADIDGLRNSQDQALRSLTTQWGAPITRPIAITPTLANPIPLSGQDLADPTD
jgi:serine-type D-Ala-D-Ala carboxypeptidase/endopeptidase (penicillin-binding protein 4)